MADSTAPAALPGTTAVAKNRHTPLGRLSSSAGTALRRIVPAADAPMPPVAAFDSAL